ncbi:MAG: exodeoxyribonuclease III [Flavobacteriales bacterium]|jgi:exodeoxyribonuclease-3|nr:exodeoxyribonuclease III [Flavobacteriales bacterium]MCB9173992.1 exodeoxyribonuclease III [Flavobacteriales bacterium]
MKIISWNVNGIRAVAKKDFFEQIKRLNPDVLCLQETKAQDDQVKETLQELSGYHIYSNSATKKGYSGTAIITKIKPLNVFPDIGMAEHDDEGRVLTAEFDDFYLTVVYVPNSGSELKRLDYRQTWDADFLKFLKKLEEKKPVVVCGDLNVAHTPIDLANPKPNYNKSAGYMQEEIDGMTNFINAGLVDTFRHFYPTKERAYSWWSYRGGARERNVGWRIDYFLVSQSFIKNVKSAAILPEEEGSDHCPVSIEITIG